MPCPHRCVKSRRLKGRIVSRSCRRLWFPPFPKPGKDGPPFMVGTKSGAPATGEAPSHMSLLVPVTSRFDETMPFRESLESQGG